MMIREVKQNEAETATDCNPELCSLVCGEENLSWGIGLSWRAPWKGGVCTNFVATFQVAQSPLKLGMPTVFVLKTQGHFLKQKESACPISVDSEQLEKLQRNRYIRLPSTEPFNYFSLDCSWYVHNTCTRSQWEGTVYIQDHLPSTDGVSCEAETVGRCSFLLLVTSTFCWLLSAVLGSCCQVWFHLRTAWKTAKYLQCLAAPLFHGSGKV